MARALPIGRAILFYDIGPRMAQASCTSHDVQSFTVFSVSTKYLMTGQNFVYTFILTTSNLGLFTIIFSTFVTELRPLIDVRISFPLDILRMNGQNLIKFCIHIKIDKI